MNNLSEEEVMIARVKKQFNELYHKDGFEAVLCRNPTGFYCYCFI
jgi:hypothetical protein